MKALIYPIALSLLFSCSSRKREEEKAEAWKEWQGKSVSAIKEHAYFKHLPLKKIKNESGIETWILKDQTRFQTDAYCSSLGGCLGMPTYNCNNVFSVKNNVILDFEQNGSCPGAKTIEAP